LVSKPLARRIALVALVVGVSAPSAVASAASLPVPWNVAALASGGASPDAVPGANDFSCKPTAAHPRPVVLVHGLGATMGANWAAMSPLLKNNGFCVFALTYGRRPGLPYFGGLARQEDSSKELDALVKHVLSATGASKVDLVGHSEGTVMPRWWMSFMGGDKLVANYVMLTPLWQGTKLAASDVLLAAGKQLPGGEAMVGQLFDSTGCGSCPEFVNGSRYLADVDRVGKALPGVQYTDIVTKYDELVSPYTSGILEAPNVKNVVLQDVCATDYSEHAAVAIDPMAGQIMLNTLDPAHARPVPCTLMTPLGAPNPPDVGLAADTSAPRSRCSVGRAFTILLHPRRRERIRRVVVTVGGRRVAVRRGRAVRLIRLGGVAPGRHVIRLRMTTTRGARTVFVRRTVRCA